MESRRDICVRPTRLSVHDELRRLAKRCMRRERPDHTLQATALVNEVYLRMIAIDQVHWRDRVHFFAIAARVMREISGGFRPQPSKPPTRGATCNRWRSTKAPLPSPEPGRDWRCLTRPCNELESVYPRKSQVVELRYFGGMKLEEAAEGAASVA